MTFKLYPEQQVAFDEIYQKLTKNNVALLTAEVGAGKTFIGTAIVNEYLKNNIDKIVIISPNQVISHWENVLSSAGIENVEVRSNVFKRGEKVDFSKYDLIIYDEVHEIKSKLNKIYESGFQGDFLGLTGTIVDKSILELAGLMNNFSKYTSIIDYQTWKNNSGLYTGDFRGLYVQMYISREFCTKLDKKSIREDLYKVNTSRKLIEMNSDERAFYTFMTSRMKTLGVSESRVRKVLNDTLDKTPDAREYATKNYENYFVGYKLHKGDKKQAELIKMLENDKSTLVYTLNNELAKQISDENANLVYVDSNNENAVELINDFLNDGKNVVLNILPLLTGVSFNSNKIIWYQTPTSLSQDEQGLGRITRLNSENTDKEIVYFGFNNTMQEELIEELQRNYEMNKSSVTKQAMPFINFDNIKK